MGYTCKKNAHGQYVTIRAEEAHLPHFSASWWDGGAWCRGHFAVRPGESPEEAAVRAFPNRGPLTVRDAGLVDA